MVQALLQALRLGPETVIDRVALPGVLDRVALAGVPLAT